MALNRIVRKGTDWEVRVTFKLFAEGGPVSGTWAPIAASKFSGGRRCSPRLGPGQISSGRAASAGCQAVVLYCTVLLYNLRKYPCPERINFWCCRIL